MNTIAVAWLLIFLSSPIWCQNSTEESRQLIGEDDTDEDSETSTTNIPLHPCHCSHITYGKDEAKGIIKSPGYPSSYCNDQTCTYEIEGHPTMNTVISLTTMSIEEQYDTLHLFYYRRVDGRLEKIFFQRLGRSFFSKFWAPPTIGFYLNMTTDHSNVGKFLMEFTREDPNSGKTTCPYPFLVATSTYKEIRMIDWPSSGCALRISSNNSISLRFKCDDHILLNGMFIRAVLSGQTSESWSSYIGGSELPIDKELSSSDIFIRSSVNPWTSTIKSMRSCSMNYHSVPYNACNCSQTMLSLEKDQSLNISSPGFPNLFCPRLMCSYTFRRTNSTKDFKNGFIISAIHFSKDRDDKLSFQVKGSEIIALLGGMDQVESSEEVIVTDTLDVLYTASSRFSNLHGFSINIKAIDINPRCLCPSNTPKFLKSKGSFSMRIYPYCPDMSCRFTIPTESYFSQNFRLSLNYRFTHEEEYFLVNTGGMEYRYTGEGYNTTIRKLNMFTDRKVDLTYRRQQINVNESDIGDSWFNMTWKWMSRQDCSCTNTIFSALVDQWDELYSPRYPEEYCLNQDCVYKIQAPDGYHVMMNVTFFETEPHADFLYIFDGFNTSEKHLQQLNGHILYIPIIETTGRNASLYFQTDSSVTAKGWVIAYKAARNSETEVENTEGHGLLIGTLLIVLILIVASALFVYNKKNESFRNPAFVPSIRCSVGEETVSEQPY